MNRRLQLRRDPSDYSKPIAVYEGVGRRANLDNYTPDRYFSRVWMSVVPPDGEDPGYACVIGEVYDPTQRLREREVWLVDEAVALDPADFSDEELEYFGIRKDNKVKPTKTRLAQAVVALKDLYWPQRCILPPATPMGSNGQVRGDRLGVPWTEFVRRIDGFMWYNPEYRGSSFRKWYPFYRAQECVIDGVVEAQREDSGYNQALIEALYDADLFKIYDHCSIYLDDQPATSRRAVGLVLAEMELTAATYMQTPVELRTGYLEPDELDDDLEEQEELERLSQEDMVKWWTGRPDVPEGAGEAAFGEEIV